MTGKICCFWILGLVGLTLIPISSMAETKLTPPSDMIVASFGDQVAISGDYALVTASSDGSGNVIVH